MNLWYFDDLLFGFEIIVNDTNASAMHLCCQKIDPENVNIPHL
jgi:hypothetical protein